MNTAKEVLSTNTIMQLCLRVDAGEVRRRLQTDINSLRSKLGRGSDKDGYINPKDFARVCVALRELRSARNVVTVVEREARP